MGIWEKGNGAETKIWTHVYSYWWCAIGPGPSKQRELGQYVSILMIQRCMYHVYVCVYIHTHIYTKSVL